LSLETKHFPRSFSGIKNPSQQM